MKDRWNRFGVVAAAALPMVAVACATIVSGGTQKIRLGSTPPGVTVTAEPGGYRATTPGEMALKRTASGYRLEVRKGRVPTGGTQLDRGHERLGVGEHRHRRRGLCAQAEDWEALYERAAERPSGGTG